MQGRPTKLTHDEVTEILWSYDKGKSIRSITKEFNIGQLKLRQLLGEHGLITTKPKQKEVDPDFNEFGEKICRGKSYRDYLRDCGIKI